jgi:hypothetical protein
MIPKDLCSPCIPIPPRSIYMYTCNVHPTPTFLFPTSLVQLIIIPTRMDLLALFLLSSMILLELLLCIQHTLLLRILSRYELEDDNEEDGVIRAVFEYVSEGMGTLLVRSCHIKHYTTARYANLPVELESRNVAKGKQKGEEREKKG